MNTLTVLLSSTPSDTYIIKDDIYLSDSTIMTIDISGVSYDRPPTNLKIDWGDNSSIYTEDNNFFPAIPDTVIQAIYGSNITLIKDYNHTYIPSASTLTTKLSCQAKITYYDGSSCIFVQPITIYSPSYHSKIKDISLIQTACIDNTGTMLYTFSTQKDGSVIESVYFNTNT